MQHKRITPKDGERVVRISKGRKVTVTTEAIKKASSSASTSVKDDKKKSDK